MAGISEKQRSPEKLDIHHGGNLKVTGADGFHVLKNKLAGKNPILAAQKALAGTQQQKRVYNFWKKGQTRTARTTRVL